MENMDLYSAWKCEKCEKEKPLFCLTELLGWGFYICTNCIEEWSNTERWLFNRWVTMGMYCACGWKITGSTHIDMVNKTITTYEPDSEGCTCDWKGWNACWENGYNIPKEVPVNLPEKDGNYSVRKFSTCGDRYETEEKYYVKPLRIDSGGYYTQFQYPVHWEKKCWDDDVVYAWKEL